MRFFATKCLLGQARALSIFLLVLLFFKPAPGAPVRIVVDSIHAHNALQSPSEAELYSYHSVYGYRRAFDFLRSRGVVVDEVKTGRIDEKVLSGAQMLFINLVSADLPPFYLSEINAIKSYLENGGSMMVIVDHTNCYYHAYKLAPLFESFGLTAHTETAADRGTAALGKGNGWIAITRFSEHPVTRGLRAVAFQSGGTIDDASAIATLSPQGWGDEWQRQPYGESKRGKPGAAPGFYGDWEQNAGERSGSLGVIAAKAVGKGRIVVVGDQNTFGDPFINYLDNYKLWLNSVGWLTGSAQIADSGEYFRWRKNRVLAYEDPTKSAFGNSDDEGFYNIFVALGRKSWAFASSDLAGDADALLFAHDNYQLPESTFGNLLQHLRNKRDIVVLSSGMAAEGGGLSLLQQVQQKLGNSIPTLRRVNNLPLRTYSWAGYGKFITIDSLAFYQNSFAPAPEDNPTAEQQAVIATALQALKIEE